MSNPKLTSPSSLSSEAPAGLAVIRDKSHRASCCRFERYTDSGVLSPGERGLAVDADDVREESREEAGD
jgi:hypothetical protein